MHEGHPRWIVTFLLRLFRTAFPLLIMWNRVWIRKKAKKKRNAVDTWMSSAASDFLFTWVLLFVLTVVMLLVAWYCLVPFMFQLLKEGLTCKAAHEAAFDLILPSSWSTWMMDKFHPSQEVRST